MTVGKRVEELRAMVPGPMGTSGAWSVVLSQNELSALIGMSERYVGQVERGQIARIGSDAACALCKVFGCSIVWLLSGGGTPPRMRAVRRAVARARARARAKASK